MKTRLFALLAANVLWAVVAGPRLPIGVLVPLSVMFGAVSTEWFLRGAVPGGRA